jgi:hypothetical protein
MRPARFHPASHRARHLFFIPRPFIYAVMTTLGTWQFIALPIFVSARLTRETKCGTLWMEKVVSGISLRVIFYAHT